MIQELVGSYSIEDYRDFSEAFSRNNDGTYNKVQILPSNIDLRVDEICDYWMEYENNELFFNELPLEIQDFFDQFVSSGGYWDLMEYILEHLKNIWCFYYYSNDAMKVFITKNITGE
jgi:hypothetical protein